VIKDDGKSVAELLREYKTDDANGQGFWSLQLLCHILSRDRILAELRKPSYSDLDAKKYVDYIWPDEEGGPTPGTQTYLKIFALLVLLKKGPDIVQFIKDKVSDQSLPLLRRPGTSKGLVDLGFKDAPGNALECLSKWDPHDRELFERVQWELLVPYFDLDKNSMAQHYPLDDMTILPWCKREKFSITSTKASKNEGGFAFVNCVKIDPLSHGFHEVLKAISLNDGLFAIKVLYEKDYQTEERFQNESDQLRRFNGLVHDHLVTLLATFTFRAQYYFLFPYADYALDQYWQKRLPRPDRNIETIRWVAKQCSGIMAAMDTIHDPKHLHHLKVKGYGMHGDIKPDNILWFNCTSDPKGILVVSDLGLASFHRETSRSNIPNKDIPKVPGYRPPECDIKGGTFSRAYDIWTLGCLFLELLTWLLGGWEYVNEFSKKRTTTFIITGAKNNIFVKFKPTKTHGLFVAQVKPEVTEWINKLRSHENCSKFILDALDVIEKEMLVVISEKKKRSSSGTLRKKFQGFQSKCQDESNSDYCMKRVLEFRFSRVQTAVDATLNEKAEETMKENPTDVEVEVHEGETHNSLGEEGLRNIDQT